MSFLTGLEPLVKKAEEKQASLLQILMDPAYAVPLFMLKMNLASRYGLKIPGAKRFAKGLIGVGARAGAQGRPLPTRVSRELFSIFGFPSIVRGLEIGHEGGRLLGPNAPEIQQNMVKGLSSPLASSVKSQLADKQLLENVARQEPRLVGKKINDMWGDQNTRPMLLKLRDAEPEMAKTMDRFKDYAGSIPLTATTKTQKTLDYLFKPVSEVKDDIVRRFRPQGPDPASLKK